jgi:hypothetical protein
MADKNVKLQIGPRLMILGVVALVVVAVVVVVALGAEEVALSIIDAISGFKESVTIDG